LNHTYFFLLLSILGTVPLFSDPAPSEGSISKKIYAHIAIKDQESACLEGKLGLEKYPHSKEIYEAYSKALASASREKMLYVVWKKYEAEFQDPYANREILETMAWGIISAGSASPLPIIRATTLIGAFFADDAKGVELLQKGMRDSNAFVRAVAVKLASHMRDAKLCDEIARLAKQEKNWNVRSEVLEAIGKMKLKEAQPLLVEIIRNNTAIAEEKAIAIKSLVEIYETAHRDELIKLTHSDRSGLRELACELIGYFNLSCEQDLLIPLLTDCNSGVRAAALHTLGILRVTLNSNPTLYALCAKLLEDPNEQVAITAAWVLTLNNSSLGRQTFERFLTDETAEARHFAAAALASTGQYGIDQMVQHFDTSHDLFVRLNLAVGMMNQRRSVSQACDVLFRALMSNKERWMWEEETHFRILQPSKIQHEDWIANFPEVINQITRLEILNILAIAKHPYVQSALKSFLQEKTVGITSIASALLLEEGDAEAIDIVEKLLEDPDQKVKTQAALVLAIWGSGEKSIQVLQESYNSADRALKERILESLGNIGDPSSIPFLVEKLSEPYQSLRILAASALLQCLNH
jgi:HEAT repeat protein